MEQLVIVREGWTWSRWHAAGFIIDTALERIGLNADGLWTESDEMRVFVGSSRECEAVASVLEGKGLRIERQSPGKGVGI